MTVRSCDISRTDIKTELKTIKPFKVGLSPSNKTCFDEIPLNMPKNAFYSILKALFVLKIFNFLPLYFGHIEKRA